MIRNLREEGTLDEQRARAVKMVTEKKVEGYFYIPASAYDSGKVEYRAENVGNFRVGERFARTIEEVIVEHRLKGQGLNPELVRELMKRHRRQVDQGERAGEEKESGFLETFFSAYIVIMMLMFLVLTSGQLLIRSVVEEKSNRVIEVLLSSCSARDLMVGKILGLSGLGILQMVIWE